MQRAWFLVPLLVVAPFLLMRQKPEARAANRIRADYWKAEKIVRSEGGLPEIERFAAALRTIRTDSAASEVKQALESIITAVEVSAAVRRAGGDTNASNERVSLAKRELLRALERGRGRRIEGQSRPGMPKRPLLATCATSGNRPCDFPKVLRLPITFEQPS